MVLLHGEMENEKIKPSCAVVILDFSVLSSSLRIVIILFNVSIAISGFFVMG